LRLVITADSGGSNGARNRLWKKELQALANESGLTLAVRYLALFCERPGCRRGERGATRYRRTHVVRARMGSPTTQRDREDADPE
jgi:hypothetical protein